jgi:hypothetical protein
MNITIDIETVPAQRPDIIAEIRESKQAELDASIAAIKPPGNYKKQETIDQWLAEEAPKIAQGLRDAFNSDVDAAYRKTGLDGAFGQVCVVGVAFDDEDPVLCWRSDWENEQGILQDFGNLMTDRVNNVFNTLVIGHNVSAFDLRFLAQRHIINGFQPHQSITRAARAKPWEDEKVFDTMVQWAGTGNRVSLDKLCKALGIQSPKGDITGATVWDAVQAGRIADVAKYCSGDVVATRQVYKRMTYQSA